jgi:hypothetical protein
LRSQVGQAGTQDRLPLTPAITSTHIPAASTRGSRMMACAASGSRISGRLPSHASVLMRMPIANSISRYASEIGTLLRRRAKSNPQIPSTRYNALTGSSCPQSTARIIDDRGVNTISVKYAAAITATNVR